MFDEVSPRYDLINDVLTVGNDRLWRIATTNALAPRKGMRVLELAAGTGTSSAAIAKHGASGVAADFSEGMLEEGRKRHAGNELIEFVFADATALPFDDNSFDAATISYGLRNVSDPRKALEEMRRVVKPGGRVVIAEFSTPPSQLVRVPYGLYGKYVLPRIAGVINRDAAEAYKYLNESIEQWPNQRELARWMREAGFERVAYRNLTFGIVALHRGFVPREVPKPAVVADATAPAPKKPAVKKPAAKKPAAKKPVAKAAPKASPAAKSATSTSKSGTAAVKKSAKQTAPAAPKQTNTVKPNAGDA
ncbi:MAG: class I SAM-dependent methyltransferase [Microbacteriaceae bacterium]|nr:class I SAM-dependent methyltransferase [Microbacteriaceae bacterium]